MSGEEEQLQRDRAHASQVDASQEEVDLVRGDTQLYGVTAPDPSKPPQRGESQGLSESSIVSFGDKKIDMTKLRDSYLGEVVAGRFVIKEFIDRGGMGEVYLAENDAVGQRVAVKFLNKKFTSDENIVNRFGNEAKSYARVNHPNAVTLLDYGQHDDGALYIITEFVDGLSLSKTIKKTGPFTPHQVISVGQQCCDVLVTAHKLGVIHRDLKPDNVMLVPSTRDRYTVKVLDFGIAKISDEEGGSMTETGAIFGTPEFMSPEQARGDGAEPRSDLYALGAILYYMLTGKLPFSGKNKFAVLNKHLNDPVIRPSERTPHIEVPPELEQVILKCLQKRAEDRYLNAEDLYEALEHARDHLGHSSTTSSSFAAVSRHAEREAVKMRESHLSLPDATVQTSEPASALAGSLVDGSFDEDEHEEHEPVEDELDMAQRVVPKVQLGAYASIPGVEISDEIEDLQGRKGALTTEEPWEEDDDEDEEEEEYDYIESPQGGRLKLLLGAIILVALVAVVGWWVNANLLRGDGGAVMSRVGDSSIDAITKAGEGGQQQALDEVERILITGQVLGLLASAEQEVEEGDLAAARKKIETTKMWLEDGALPGEGLRRREALEATISQLFEKERELKALRANNKCKTLAAELVGLSEQSEGLAKKWEGIEQECVSASTTSNESGRRDVRTQPEKTPTPPPGDRGKAQSPPQVNLPSPGAVLGTAPKQGEEEKETSPEEEDDSASQTNGPSEEENAEGQEDAFGLPPKTL